MSEQKSTVERMMENAPNPEEPLTEADLIFLSKVLEVAQEEGKCLDCGKILDESDTSFTDHGSPHCENCIERVMNTTLKDLEKLFSF